MKVSTKGRYALRMVLDLAQQQKDGYIALKDVANRQHISKKYLEQIVPILTKAGLIQSTRGFQGGYRLMVAPEACTVGQILRLTEGTMCPLPCLEENAPACQQREACLTVKMWQGLDKAINSYIDSITLQDLLEGNEEKFS